MNLEEANLIAQRHEDAYGPPNTRAPGLRRHRQLEETANRAARRTQQSPAGNGHYIRPDRRLQRNKQRSIEEVFGLGDRAVARWHLTFVDRARAQVSQHGCSVVEHDGERIQRFWAYYPDLVEVDPSELERD